MVASVQVSEAIKIMLGMDELLIRKMLFIDLLGNDFQIAEV